MYIHEYQGKLLLSKDGIPVPYGEVATSPQAAVSAFQRLRSDKVVLKAQIHAGGRGKAGGVVLVDSPKAAEEEARRLLGSTLITHQTGPRGRLVEKVLLEGAVDIHRELYISLTLDRNVGSPLLIASSRGGMDIEELSSSDPQALIKEWGDPVAGFYPYQGRKVFSHLDLPPALLRPVTNLLLSLGTAFLRYDCSLIEVNPLILTDQGELLVADLKMNIDDNALFRHAELADLRDPSQEDEREIEARRHDLSYVGLDGDIGCMVNGAGLAMATMDLLKKHGGRPANFLDVGGNATVERVTAAFQLICRDTNVRSILVNIFGGIVRCDLIAEGILEAVERTGLSLPLVVRLEGNHAEEGQAALEASSLNLVSATDLGEAAEKAVALSKS